MLAPRSRNVLFIGHEGSISGAPVLLLNLLLLLQRQGYRFTLVVAVGGPFVDTYRRHFPVMVMKPSGYGKEKNPFRRFRNILLNRVRVARLLLRAWKADAVVSNTIVNGRLLRRLYPFRNKMVCYVHELESMIRYYPEEAALSMQLCRLFAYPSGAVRHTLQQGHGIGADRLHRLSYYFPVEEQLLNSSSARKQFAHDFRQRFGLDNDFVVGGMGVICKRKGTDLFLAVCEQVARQQPDIRFCWIGPFESEGTRREIQAQMEERQLQHQIVFTDVLPHHYYNLAAFDLFFLSSREDPYPLVVLEAGFMEVPAICFAASGGITEFVDSDAGWIIDDFSVAQTAELILHLYRHRDDLVKKGAIARSKSLELHSNPSRILKEFNHLLDQIA